MTEVGYYSVWEIMAFAAIGSTLLFAIAYKSVGRVLRDIPCPHS